MPVKLFQSLSGFQVRCNLDVLGVGPVAPVWFQSLSGFQVRCNVGGGHLLGLRKHGFQSLSGFQVRCNSDPQSSFVLQDLCFNPYRVFKFVATSPICSMISDNLHVSIPIGFSSSLQPSLHRTPRHTESAFQSLSGFQVRCNIRPEG